MMSCTFEHLVHACVAYSHIGGVVMVKIAEVISQELDFIAWFAKILIFVMVVRRQGTGLQGLVLIYLRFWNIPNQLK